MVALQNDQDFTPVTLVSLKDCFKNLPLDIYIKLAEGKFVKAFEKKTGLDFSRLAAYESKGVKMFYAPVADREALERYFSRSPLMTLTSETATPEAKRQAFFAVMEQTLFESFSSVSLNQSSIDKTFEALKVSLLKDGEFLKVITLLTQMAPKTDLFFRHAISTAIYTYVIARIAGQNSERSLKILLFSALFHDLGKLKLPESRRIASQNRTMGEIEEFRKHPIFTVKMFVQPLPYADEEIRRCILLHKERLDGKGYPYEVRGVGIYALAKILAIADSFSELTLGLEDGNCYSRVQAIANMKSDAGHFDPKLLMPFAQLVLSRDLADAA